MKRHETYGVNADKFAALMAKHNLDSGVDAVRLFIKTMQGENIRPLARKFIVDRLGQCMEAWECAAGLWRIGPDGSAELDVEKWDWDDFRRELTEALDEVL